MCDEINPEALLGKGIPDNIFLKCQFCLKKRLSKKRRSWTDVFADRVIPEKDS